MIPQDYNTFDGPAAVGGVGRPATKREGDPTDAAVEDALGFSSITGRSLLQAVVRGKETEKALEAAAEVAAGWSYADKMRLQAEWDRLAENSNLLRVKPITPEWAALHPKIATPDFSDNVKPRQRATIQVFRKVTVVKMHYATIAQRAYSPESLRGQVTTFSARSRRRMQVTLAKINDMRRAFFLTLTYPDTFPDNPDVFKAHLKAFVKRLKRLWADVGGVWRLEIKKRKSGANKGRVAPHYHVILWIDDGETAANFSEWAARAWLQVIGAQNNKHARKHACTVRKVENLDHASYYVTKYAAKTGDDGDGIAWGRRWGYFGQISKDVPQTTSLELVEHRFLKRKLATWLISHYPSSAGYVSWMLEPGNDAGYTVLGLGYDTVEEGRRSLPKMWAAVLACMEGDYAEVN